MNEVRWRLVEGLLCSVIAARVGWWLVGEVLWAQIAVLAAGGFFTVSYLLLLLVELALWVLEDR